MEGLPINLAKIASERYGCAGWQKRKWNMTGIVYEPAALRILARMPAHDQAALRRKVRQYADTGIGDVLKLAGSDERRLRHGDWRAIFVVRTDIIVIRIAHRRDAYR